jgi:hypothetical protein
MPANPDPRRYEEAEKSPRSRNPDTPRRPSRAPTARSRRRGCRGSSHESEGSLGESRGGKPTRIPHPQILGQLGGWYGRTWVGTVKAVRCVLSLRRSRARPPGRAEPSEAASGARTHLPGDQVWPQTRPHDLCDAPTGDTNRRLAGKSDSAPGRNRTSARGSGIHRSTLHRFRQDTADYGRIRFRDGLRLDRNERIPLTATVFPASPGRRLVDGDAL